MDLETTCRTEVTRLVSPKWLRLVQRILGGVPAIIATLLQGGKANARDVPSNPEGVAVAMTIPFPLERVIFVVLRAQATRSAVRTGASDPLRQYVRLAGPQAATVLGSFHFLLGCILTKDGGGSI